MLDGDEAAPPDDVPLQRVWHEVTYAMLVSHIAEGYSIAPSDAERELARDPHDHLALRILDYRAYRDAKAAFDRARNLVTDLRGWEGSPHMTLVESHAWARQQAALEGGGDG